MEFKRALAALIVAVALAGCAGASIGVRSGSSPSMRSGAPPPGGSYSSAAFQAQVSPNAYFGVFFLGAVMLGTHGDDRRWSGAASLGKPPPLAADRAVAERDCSRPMEPPSANLRCK